MSGKSDDAVTSWAIFPVNSYRSLLDAVYSAYLQLLVSRRSFIHSMHFHVAFTLITVGTQTARAITPAILCR
jgi:hypothetical protein